MGALRRFFGTCKRLTWLLVACILFARIVIPTGFMPVAAAGGTMIQMCTGLGAASIVVDASGKEIPVKDQHKGDNPCAFSGLGTPSLAGAAPLLLALALLFVLATGLRPATTPVLHSIRRLRPPLRGPPTGH